MHIARTFPIYHEWKFLFALDMTNVANHVVYSGPSATVQSGSNSTFGTISAVANYPRDIQASARISW
jgi:hypothetical protein